MLDVRKMRVLREVAGKGSFSAAAESLAYTQSAVSQQIAALERETGVTLLERGSRGVRLTDAGAALVRHTDVVLARLADAQRELEAIAGLRGGQLRMASFPTAGATLMPLAIAVFRRRHPDVELSLDQAEPEDGLVGLRRGDYDVVLTVAADDPACRIGAGINSVALLDDPMFVVLPREHPHARKPRLRLEELADEAWMSGISRSCPDARLLVRACHDAGFEPRVAFESSDYAAIQGFVAAGVGVALIPDLGLTTVRDDVVIRSLGARTPVRHVVAATVAGGYRSAAASAMLDILVEVSAQFAAHRRALAVAA